MSGMRRRIFTAKCAHHLLLVLFLFAIPFASVLADEEGGRRHAGVESVHVEVVNVDVVVLGKDGERVMDLARDDFVVLENGREVEISNFQVFRGGPPAAPTPAEGTPPAAVSGAGDERHRLRLMVFLDNYHMRFGNRSRVMNRLRPFLDEVLEGNAEVMLLSAGRRMYIEQPFTSDRDEVHASLDRLGRRLTGAEVLASEDVLLDRWIQEQQDMGMEVDPSEFFVHFFSADRFSQVNATLELLENCVTAMAGMEGRKVLLYVSEGFPFSTGAQQFARYDDRTPAYSATSHYNVADRLEDLARLANGNRVTFYTLSATGLDAFSENDSRSNTIAPLVHMAASTGGRTLFSGNDFTGWLRKSAGDFRSYYSIGYRRGRAPERERFARIKVKVARPGLEVLHRKGDFNKPQDERYRDRVRTALLLGRGENPHGMGIDVSGKGVPAGGGFYSTPVTVNVPVESLILLPREDVRVGGFRLFVGVLGPDGNMQRMREYDYDVDLPESGNGSSEIYPARFDLRLWPGENILAVGLKDDNGTDFSLLSASFVLARGGS